MSQMSLIETHRRRTLQDTFEVIQETAEVINGTSEIHVIEITEQEYKTDPRFRWDGQQIIPNALVSSELPNQIFRGSGRGRGGVYRLP